MKDAYSFDRDDAELVASFEATGRRTSGSSSGVGSRRYAVGGRERDHGRESASTSSRRRARARTRWCAARTATTWQIRGALRHRPPAPSFPPARVHRRRSRPRARRPSRRSPRSSGSTAPPPRRRCRSSADGRRARARPRRRSPERGEADGGDLRAAIGRLTDEEIRETFGAGRRLDWAAASRRRSDCRRGACAKGSSLPARTVTAGTSWRSGGPRLRGDLRGHPRGHAGRRLPRVRREPPWSEPAIEVGHIFELGTFHSAAARCEVCRRGRQRAADRSWAATGSGRGASWRQSSSSISDESGIFWPSAVAPYDVHSSLSARARGAGGGAELESDSRRTGVSVLLDDRDLRAGEKFADADLIGCPVRITVGKKTLEDGAVDVRMRETGDERRVAMSEWGGV